MSAAAPVDVAGESRAEDRIDDDFARSNDLRMPGLELPARRDEFVVCAKCVSRQAGRIRDGNDVNPEPLRAGNAGNHVTVAAVVAGPAQHDDRACVRPALTQRVEGRVTRARHEFVARKVEALDGSTIEFAHCGGGEEPGGERVHPAIILPASLARSVPSHATPIATRCVARAVDQGLGP